MKPMNFNGLEIVEVDTTWSRLPRSFYELKPTVYKDGNAFCCLFGGDPQEGIFGCGDNPEEAIRDWDSHLTNVLRDPDTTADMTESIRTAINDSKRDDYKNFKGEF